VDVKELGRVGEGASAHEQVVGPEECHCDLLALVQRLVCNVQLAYMVCKVHRDVASSARVRQAAEQRGFQPASERRPILTAHLPPPFVSPTVQTCSLMMPYVLMTSPTLTSLLRTFFSNTFRGGIEHGQLARQAPAVKSCKAPSKPTF
jgi:hypothetical protein